MVDHLSALERLQRLRESGAVTGAEFQVEKERILRGSGAEVDEPELIYREAGSSRARLYLTLGFVVLVIGTIAGLMFGLRRDDGAPNESMAEQPVVASKASDKVAAPPTVDQRSRTDGPAVVAPSEVTFLRRVTAECLSTANTPSRQHALGCQALISHLRDAGFESGFRPSADERVDLWWRGFYETCLNTEFAGPTADRQIVGPMPTPEQERGCEKAVNLATG